MNDTRKILLLDVGCEGGGLRLYLAPNELGIFTYQLQTDSDKRFFLEDDDDEPLGKRRREVSYMRDAHPLVIDWAGALRLLDDTGWPWPVFYPMFVHPSIRPNIIYALKDRYSRFPDIRFEEWEQDNDMAEQDKGPYK